MTDLPMWPVLIYIAAGLFGLAAVSALLMVASQIAGNRSVEWLAFDAFVLLAVPAVVLIALGVFGWWTFLAFALFSVLVLVLRSLKELW